MILSCHCHVQSRGYKLRSLSCFPSDTASARRGGAPSHQIRQLLRLDWETSEKQNCCAAGSVTLQLSGRSYLRLLLKPLTVSVLIKHTSRERWQESWRTVNRSFITCEGWGSASGSQFSSSSYHIPPDANAWRRSRLDSCTGCTQNF